MAEPDATNRLDAGDRAAAVPTQRQPVAEGGMRTRLLPLLQAAGLAFLALLALGAVFLIVLKLQFTDIGAGADPIDVLTSLVILALATLRVPIHIGDVTITILPLGAMVVVGSIVHWSCRTTVAAARPRSGLLVGLFFGAIAALAALVFRLRFEPDPVYAGSVGALWWGTIWVSAWAALSFATTGSTLRNALRRKAVVVRRERPVVFDGIRIGLLMLVLACLSGAAAGLLWTIVVLFRGGGPSYDHVGHVVVALVYVVAFAPNLVVAIVSLALGAPLEIGAGLTIGGKVRESVREISVFDGGFDPMLLMLLVPLLSCTAAGYWARKHVAEPKNAWRVFGIAAIVFASVLAMAGMIGDVRLGAQLTPAERGFGLVAPRPGLVLLLGLAWAAGGGYAGWTAAGRRS